DETFVRRRSKSVARRRACGPRSAQRSAAGSSRSFASAAHRVLGRTHLRTVALAASLMLLSCGGPPSNIDPVTPGPHLPLPVVPNPGNPVIAHPSIVPIFFSDHPYKTELKAFTAWVMTSDWYASTLSEYGIS